MRSERAINAAGVDALSAATRAAAVAPGAFTRLSASKCMGVHGTCMSGGDTSCDSAEAVVPSGTVPLVQGFGFRVQGSGFRTQDLGIGFRV